MKENDLKLETGIANIKYKIYQLKEISNNRMHKQDLRIKKLGEAMVSRERNDLLLTERTDALEKKFNELTGELKQKQSMIFTLGFIVFFHTAILATMILRKIYLSFRRIDTLSPGILNYKHIQKTNPPSPQDIKELDRMSSSDDIHFSLAHPMKKNKSFNDIYIALEDDEDQVVDSSRFMLEESSIRKAYLTINGIDLVNNFIDNDEHEIKDATTKSAVSHKKRVPNGKKNKKKKKSIKFKK